MSVSIIFDKLGGGPYQVGGDNGVQSLGLQDHSGSHGVNKHLVDCDIRELGGNLSGNLIPQHHAVSLSVALGNDSDELTGSLLSSLESKAHESSNSMTGKDGNLGGCLPGTATVGTAALTGVLSFTVLTDDNPVKVARLAVAEG